MKKIIAIVLLAAITATFTSSAYAGWVDDWLQQKTVSSPDYLEGQKRGYFTAGSFDARWYQGQDYLFSIEPPKFKAGCGGIDAFMGGFSFLNFNYLVQKLQSMLQSAPAIAFDIALNTLCSQCSTTLGKFENIIDKLNNLQLDDCKASKALVATIASPLEGGHMPAQYESALADFEQSSGITSLWQDVKKETSANNDEPTTNMSGAYAGCPPDVKDIFATTGSVLDHLGTKFGASQDYINLMRGFLGDVALQNTPNGVYFATYMPPCPQNKNKTVDNLIDGNAQAETASGPSSCQPITDTNRDLVQWASNMMSNITLKMKDKFALGTDEVNFLQEIPLPLKLILKYAINTGQESSMTSQMSDVAARAYAFAMMRDLYYEAEAVVNNGYMIYTDQPGAVPAARESTCKIDLSGAPGEMQKFMKELNARQRDIENEYVAWASKLNSLETLVARMQDFNDQAYRVLSDKFGPSLARRAVGG